MPIEVPSHLVFNVNYEVRVAKKGIVNMYDVMVICLLCIYICDACEACDVCEVMRDVVARVITHYDAYIKRNIVQLNM